MVVATGIERSGGFKICIRGRANKVLLVDELDTGYKGRRRTEDTS